MSPRVSLEKSYGYPQRIAGFPRKLFRLLSPVVSLANMAKRSKHSLLDEVAADEAAAPSLFLVSTEEEANEEMERRGEFTAERLMESRPTIYRAIVDGLGQGLGVRQLCRAYRVSHHTVSAVMARESAAVATLKERTVATLRTFGRLAADRLLDEVDQIPIQSLPIALGIAVEKAELLAGGATSRIEHTESGPTHEDYIRMISGKVIEAETVPAIGFQGEEVAQKEADQAATVQAETVPAALLPSVSPADLVPTGSREESLASDKLSEVLPVSVSIESGSDTSLDTIQASSEAFLGVTSGAQEPGKHVEESKAEQDAGTQAEKQKRAKRPRTEGGRGSANSRRVSRGH